MQNIGDTVKQQDDTEGMLVFLHDVRNLAVPRLKDEEARIRAWIPTISWRPRTLQNRLRIMANYGQVGVDLGVTELDYENARALGITLHRDDLSLQRPYGEAIAFTMIHETAHAATLEAHTPLWAEYCQQMGICEYPYDTFKASGTESVAMVFKDHDFLRQIKRLGSYPGDEPSTEEINRMRGLINKADMLLAMLQFRS